MQLLGRHPATPPHQGAPGSRGQTAGQANQAMNLRDRGPRPNESACAAVPATGAAPYGPQSRRHISLYSAPGRPVPGQDGAELVAGKASAAAEAGSSETRHAPDGSRACGSASWARKSSSLRAPKADLLRTSSPWAGHHTVVAHGTLSLTLRAPRRRRPSASRTRCRPQCAAACSRGTSGWRFSRSGASRPGTSSSPRPWDHPRTRR